MTLLDQRLWFPDPRSASPEGIVALGGDLSVPRLLLAYRSGIFPWSAEPITWWSPDPRGVLELEAFHVPRSLERALKRRPFEITCDRAFRAVMIGCATARTRGNWITPPFIEAYTRLHETGHAHSVECWRDGELAGGIYGVAIGGFFAGESMFHRASDASKIALWHLVQRLRERGFGLFDLQMVTPITRRLGATEISREAYLRRLADALRRDCHWA